MKDSATSGSSFSSVAIKQEPQELDQDSPGNGFDKNKNNNNDNGTSVRNLDSAVDLRADPDSRNADARSGRGRERGSEGEGLLLSVGGLAASNAHDFVAEIARRVREESGLRALELTPVSTLGPLTSSVNKVAALVEGRGTGLALYATPPQLPPSLPSPALLPSSEGRGKSRGEYACRECSSRFDTARDFRAHCLTHQVLLAESRLRSARRGGGGGGTVGGGEMVEEDGLFTGLGATGIEGASCFTCEDCGARFSSRDTYAMHMLIRAKNDACFPRQSQEALTTTTDASITIAPSNSISAIASSTACSGKANHIYSGMVDANKPGLLSPLPPALLLAESTSAAQVGVRAAELQCESSVGSGDHRRRALSEQEGCLNHLGLELSRGAVDYSTAWWSKYLPWVTASMGLLPGIGGVGAVVGDTEGPRLPLVCYVCGELFTSRDSLAMHVLFHTRDAPALDLKDAPAASSAWRKAYAARVDHPLAASTKLTSSLSLATSNLLLMGEVSERQQSLSSDRPYGLFHNINGHEQSRSPTVAAVASAAAAALAAVGPSNQQSATSSSGELARDTSPRTRSGSDLEVSFLARDGNGREDPPTSHTDSLSVILPKRGSSAPVFSIAPPAASPIAVDLICQPAVPTALADLPLASEKLRPYSADHVAMRHQPPPLLASSAAGPALPLRHSDEVSRLGPAPSTVTPPWHFGAETGQSAFSVYRFQRLKKLRLVKGLYKRPGARGRPPMTIYGTAGRRTTLAHSGVASAPYTSSSTSSFTSSPGDPVADSAGPDSKFSSLVHLLTSSGQEVSTCAHCELLFGDRTLYQLHMGLHNVNNPWQCNACGYVCTSRLHFATHTLHY